MVEGYKQIHSLGQHLQDKICVVYWIVPLNNKSTDLHVWKICLHFLGRVPDFQDLPN